MIDKLKFNNLVVSNKNGIQQSRIQTINKLVHKIRRLKTMLEKHPDNAKCKERIRKSTETMQLKCMDVVKKVFLMEKPALSVITNGASTPEEVAVSLLSLNKVMQTLVKRFKAELQLNEVENDKWKEVLMEPSKRRKKIEKTEEKRRKRFELKQQKEIGHKRQKWLEENLHCNGSDITFETDLNISTTGGWKIEDLLTDNGIEKSNSILISDHRQAMEKEIPLNENPGNTNKNTLMIRKSIGVQREIYKESNITKAKHNIISLYENEISNETEEQTAESLVVDPFFITDNGENYLSTAIVRKDDTVIGEKIAERDDLHMIKLNFDKKAINFNNRRYKAFDKNKHMQKSSEKKWNDKLNSEKKLQGSWNVTNQHKKQNSFQHNLHPSWEAKQRLKPTLTAFQGKKIKFGDDPSETSKQDGKDFKSSSKTFKQDKNKKDSIHPSWAAKQKLKPIITTFQGKKITFDDNK